MKTFSFPTCKGLLKITATTREDALYIFKILARKNKRAEYVPVGRERMKKYKLMIHGDLEPRPVGMFLTVIGYHGFEQSVLERTRL